MRNVHMSTQTRNVDIRRPIHPFPPAARRIAERLQRLLGVAFDQLTVNEYEPGVGLSSHVDTHSAFTGECLFGARQSLTHTDHSHLQTFL
jgi:alkylated DNA repair dioxygenase AlkB